MKKKIKICMTDSLILDLDEAAKKIGVSRSHLIERAVLDYLPKIRVEEKKKYSSEDEDKEFLEWLKTEVGIEDV